MSGAEAAVRARTLALLQADAELAGLVHGIFDGMPARATAPFVALDAAEGRERKQARKETIETDQKKAKTPAAGKDSLAPPKSGEDPGHKNGTAPAVEVGGDISLDDDVQLQKAGELLKTWKIFKELRPS